MQSSEREEHGFFQTNGTATQRQSRKNFTIESEGDEYDEITIVNTTRVRRPKTKQVKAKLSLKSIHECNSFKFL